MRTDLTKMTRGCFQCGPSPSRTVSAMASPKSWRLFSRSRRACRRTMLTKPLLQAYVCVLFNITVLPMHCTSAERERERERRGGARVYSTEYVCNCLYTYDVQYVVVDHSPFHPENGRSSQNTKLLSRNFCKQKDKLSFAGPMWSNNVFYENKNKLLYLPFIIDCFMIAGLLSHPLQKHFQSYGSFR